MSSTIIKIESDGIKCLQQMCRLCMEEQCLEDVFNENDLHQWISNYLSITIFSEDSKGHSICTSCRLRLTEFHQYWVRCQKVQTILESMVRDENGTSTSLGNTELQKVKTEPFEQVDIKYEMEHDEVGSTSRTETQSSVDSSSLGYFGFETQPLSAEIRDSIIGHEGERHFRFDHKDEGYIRSTDKMDEVNIQQVKVEILSDGEESLPNQSGQNVSIESNSPEATEKPDLECDKIQCTQCDRSFPDKKTYRNHMRWHKPKNHSCHICGKPFVYRSALEKHIPMHDPNRVRQPATDKPSLAPGLYHCDICLKVFELKTRLWAHKTQVHRPKAHECHLCDLKFTTRTALGRHVRKHYQESGNIDPAEKLVPPSTTYASQKK